MTALLPSIQRWQKVLIQEGLVQVPDGDRPHRQTGQLTLLRVVIWRILECWGIEPDGQLRQIAEGADGFPLLCARLGEMSDRYQLPLLHPALPRGDPRAVHLPPMVHLSPDLLSALALDLSTELWITALETDPATVLNEICTVSASVESVQAQASHRKSYGAYYTPPDIVRSMVDMALDAHQHHHGAIAPSLHILDPACGFGVFLIAAYERLVAHSAYRQISKLSEFASPDGFEGLDSALNAIYGVDLDPQAVDVTRLLLVLTFLKHRNVALNGRRAIATPLFAHLSTRIHWGNAVIASDVAADRAIPMSPTVLAQVCPLDWEQTFPSVMSAGGFDLVIGNPPYLDSEWMTRHMPTERHYCAIHYESAVGNWDLFCVFIEQAFRLCKPDGFTSLLVPNKLLSADYATQSRQILAIANTLLRLRDYSQVPLFPVAVYPIVYLAQKRPPTQPNPIQYDYMATANESDLAVQSSHSVPYERFVAPRLTWYTVSSDLFALIDRIEAQSTSLGAIATVRGAATVAEAYDIQPLLQDNGQLDPQSAIRMVNSGTIDRYVTLWGRKPLRYLKQTYLHPVIPLPQQALLPKARQQQATQPKLIVASMTKVVECAIDRQGIFLAGKSTSIVQSAIALPYLLALLNSRLMSFYYAVVFGGDRLQGGYLRVGVAQLRSLPIAIPAQGFSSLFVQHGLDQVEQLLAAKREASSTRLHAQALDRAVDQWVYQLYGLSTQEVAILEANTQGD